MKISAYMPFKLESGLIASKIPQPIQSHIISTNKKIFKLSTKLKQNSLIKWINHGQETQHSNAIGGACCASTSVAASQSVDDAAQAANGSGAKQWHSFEPSNSADIGSVTATSIANPLILHSCLGLWRELNHLHQKYKKHYQQIKSDIKINKSNNNFDIRSLVAKNYMKEHVDAFRTEKHLTSWLTAISSLLVLLKFTANGVLGVGLLLSAVKSLGKVTQRCMQITKKSFDIYNNHKQKQACKDNLNLLNQLNNELSELITSLENKDNPSDVIKKKIEEYTIQLNEYQNGAETSQKDLDRYSKLKKHFFQDIKLLSADGFFWLANACANIGMAVANFISSAHGFPLAAILVLILGSTFGVIYSNNKLLTGKHLPGCTEAEFGRNLQHNYQDFSLEHAEKEFDLNYDLYKIFKDKSKILNKPFNTKSKIFITKWTIRLIMFLSFGTYTDSMVRLRRKFRAYKATLYKAEDEQLINWINEINKLTDENYINNTNDNLFVSIKKFQKQEYIAKELAFNISKFK